MRDNSPAIGKVDFESFLARVRLLRDPVAPAVTHIHVGALQSTPELRSKDIEAIAPHAFRLVGIGADDVEWFVCRVPDMEAVLGGREAWAASAIGYGVMLPGSMFREERDAAILEAIKFLYRYPEEERAAEIERLKVEAAGRAAALYKLTHRRGRK